MGLERGSLGPRLRIWGNLSAQLSTTRIVGVALLLFSAVLLGVGIHHLVATGTCSSTGYSANYGPVPTCPSGTGWWFLFVFGGIIGSLIGALMAGSVAMVFMGIFGAIGFGSLTLLFDSHLRSGTKIFGGVFGGCFAVVGVGAGIAVIGGALASLRGSTRRRPAAPGPPGAPALGSFGSAQSSSAFGTPQASSGFTAAATSTDPIMSAYHASREAALPPTVPSSPAPSSPVPPPPVSPLGLIPGLLAAKQTAQGDAVDDLAKLADMHAKGALTDAEFAAAKAKLLGNL